MKMTINYKRTMIIAVALMIVALFGAVKANAAEYTDAQTAGQEIVDEIEDHEDTFQIEYAKAYDHKITSNELNELGVELFNEAVKSSDDYIKYGVYDSYQVSGKATKTAEDDEYHFTFTYKVNYKLTKAQENAFEKKLDKTVKKLHLNGKSSKAKVKKIYKWITKNVKYDKKSAGTTKYTAYAALNKKKAVCQGYSVLFYRMCEKAGVDAKVITGTSRNENHAWNIVKIGKKYYNADSTWDAGKTQKNYKYFLKGNKTFKNHVRSNEYSSNTFYNAYPMARK